MLRRLEEMKLSRDDLVTVARGFDAIDPDQIWSDIGEDRFTAMLKEDNWKLVEAELKKLVQNG